MHYNHNGNIFSTACFISDGSVQEVPPPPPTLCLTSFRNQTVDTCVTNSSDETHMTAASSQQVWSIWSFNQWKLCLSVWISLRRISEVQLLYSWGFFLSQNRNEKKEEIQPIKADFLMSSQSSMRRPEGPPMLLWAWDVTLHQDGEENKWGGGK